MEPKARGAKKLENTPCDCGYEKHRAAKHVEGIKRVVVIDPGQVRMLQGVRFNVVDWAQWLDTETRCAAVHPDLPTSSVSAAAARYETVHLSGHEWKTLLGRWKRQRRSVKAIRRLKRNEKAWKHRSRHGWLPTKVIEAQDLLGKGQAWNACFTIENVLCFQKIHSGLQ